MWKAGFLARRPRITRQRDTVSKFLNILQTEGEHQYIQYLASGCTAIKIGFEFIAVNFEMEESCYKLY